jgi:hypothetical protein
MNAFAEILETIAHAPIEKRTVTNHDVLNETYCYAKGVRDARFETMQRTTQQ